MSDRRDPPSEAVRLRMRAQRREGTDPEMVLRRKLFALKLRYRVGYRVPGLSRRTIDIAFTGPRVAVFVDGCFWHKCPDHHVPAKNNSSWWEAKLNANVARDRDTDRHLSALGWRVVRVWEHQDMDATAVFIRDEVRRGSH